MLSAPSPDSRRTAGVQAGVPVPLAFVPVVAVVLVLVGSACTSPSEPPPADPSTTGSSAGHTAEDATAAPAAAWRQLEPAPTARTEVTAVPDGDDRIHLVGGFAEGRDTVALVEIFDPAQDTWSRGPDLPVAVNHAMSARLGGSVVVLGGYTGPGLGNPTDRAFLLRDGRWHELPAMPAPRAAAAAATIDRRVYVAGGVGPDGLAADMFVYDARDGAWRTLDGPPTRREHLGVAATGGRLYVVGGRTGGIGTNLAAAELFDPANGTWTALADMPTPRGGMSAAATDGGLVVTAGGEETGGTFDEVEAFDVGAGQWRSIGPMPTARHGLGVAAVGDTVYTLAGGPQPGYSFSSANEAITLVGTSRRRPRRRARRTLRIPACGRP